MSKKKNRIGDKLFYRILLLVGMIVRRLNRAHAAAIAGITGDIVYDRLKIRRELVETNLSLTFPEKSGEEIRRIARQVYRNLAENAMEVLRLPLIQTPEDAVSLLQIDARAFLARTRESGKGAVLVSAHFGNWELLGIGLCLLVSPATVVAKKLKNSEVDGLVNKWRSMRGNRVVYKKQALREGIRTLRSGGIMSILADQSDPNGGFFMDFLGRRTSVFVGPAYLALKTGVPLFVIMCRRNGSGRYIAEFEEVQTSDLGDGKEDAEELARRYTRVLERYIRAYPEEWFWVHNRWKRTDPGV